MSNSFRLETLALHAGQAADTATGARAVPIYRTTAYQFDDTDHAANLFALKELGNIYTRIMNPTQDVLEQRMAALEGGAAALALASGTSAIFYSIINLAGAGDEIVSANNLYGGTYTMFDSILPQFGISVRMVDPLDLDAVKGAITEKTRALFAETIGNPGLDVVDLDKLAKIAHDAGIPFIVDSTFTTPYLVRPIEHGVDIVVHSLTKWLGGHGAGIGGVVVDAGKFDWGASKHKLYTEPDDSYHGLVWGKDLGDLQSIAYTLRMRTVPLRNLGACISPDNAWMFLQGIETLPLRMERHCENAIAVAKFLVNHDRVEWVRFPGLDGHRSNKTATELFGGKGFGGIVVFGVKGGQEAGAKFINSLELHSHVANVGDAKSLAIHPASTTHSQLSEEQQREGGIEPELVRLSVGIEHIDDITEDLDRALRA